MASALQLNDSTLKSDSALRELRQPLDEVAINKVAAKLNQAIEDEEEDESIVQLLDALVSCMQRDENAHFSVQDGRGMYVLVKPNEGKYFRFNYRFGGKQKTMALGVYPSTTLAQARRKLEEARALLKKGIDPNQPPKRINHSSR
jgi:hypothetical protein